MVEYGLLLMLIALVVVGIVGTIGQQVLGMFQQVVFG